MAKQRIVTGDWPGFYPGDWVRPRSNSGKWTPFVDVHEIFPGNTSVSRDKKYALFDVPIGIQLKIETANKTPMVFDGQGDWEIDGVRRPKYFWEDSEKYHLLYDVQEEFTCYAYSDDGYNWIRPVMDEVEYNNSTKNNIVSTIIGSASGFFEDVSAPPEERYKAMGGDAGWYDPDTWEPVTGSEVSKRWDAQQYEGASYKGPKIVLRGWMVGWTSPDRLHWTKIEDPLAEYSVNGAISARYDPKSKTYFAYMQPQGFTPEEPKGIGSGVKEANMVRRANGFSRTKDFRHWPAPKLIHHPDAQDGLDDSFYSHNYFPYPDRDDIHCMGIPTFHQISGQMDVQIAFSRDGLFWSRPERKAIIPNGVPGSGEEGMVSDWKCGIAKLSDGAWGIGYTGHYRLHNVRPEFEEEMFPFKQPIKAAWAIWQPHRMCGVEAVEEGRFTIPTIARCNDELRFNYRCEPGGWIYVELLPFIPSMMHADVSPIAGFTFGSCDALVGDSLDKVVTWNGDGNISAIGEMVAIRVRMFRAKLFAYSV